MCDFSEKLLPGSIGNCPKRKPPFSRGTSACAECRGRIGIYRQVSESFDAHCDAAFASRVRSKPPRWIAVASAAAAAVAVAAVILFLLALPSTSRKQPSSPRQPWPVAHPPLPRMNPPWSNASASPLRHRRFAAHRWMRLRTHRLQKPRPPKSKSLRSSFRLRARFHLSPPSKLPFQPMPCFLPARFPQA